MSIKSYVDEIERINSEIKRNCKRNKELRTRAKELEKSITDYLKSKDQAGLKYNGTAIIIESKAKRPPKKKKEKEQDVMELLRNLGVSDTNNAYKQLIEVQKGNPVDAEKLSFKKIEPSRY
jgi:hypothetical protein